MTSAAPEILLEPNEEETRDVTTREITKMQEGDLSGQ